MKTLIEKFNHSLILLEKLIEKYPQIAVACSFGKDSTITAYLAKIIKPDIKIFSVMTYYKFLETWEYLKEINKLLKFEVEVFMAFDEYPKILKNSGIKMTLYPDLFEKFRAENDRKNPLLKTARCCELLKVIPFQRAVAELNLQAWISGLRRDESEERKNTPEIEEKKGLIKINPIIDWTIKDIWQAMEANCIPRHPLYDKGYLSLGCEPCTFPSSTEERAGRFTETERAGGECGIHL